MSPDPVFEEHRPVLHRLAYRMLGTLADADDVLQDAYLRWTRSGREAVESARAYLMSVVTRLCIDYKRTQAARREAYVGPWLPEPLVSQPQTETERAESISMALLVVLEKLTPVERAAYLLKRVFDYDYSEISSILGKSEPACRQLVSRAEERVQSERPRFEPAPEDAQRLTSSFLQACTTGDMDGLLRLLTEDVVIYSDGGGKVTAARVPVVGAERVVKFLIGISTKYHSDVEATVVDVNGQPGILLRHQGEIVSVTTMQITEGRIQEIYIMRNPDKLQHVPVA